MAPNIQEAQQLHPLLQWRPIDPWDPVPDWLLRVLDDRLVLEIGKAQLEFEKTLFQARLDLANKSLDVLSKAKRG
jgi:hypothetical protein